MNVVYASNDGYIRHLAVSMCSLFDRNRQCPSLTVYIMSLGLSEENAAKLMEIGDRYGRRLVILEMGDLKERFEFQADTGGYDISIMARLFMGEVLPEHMERVLYLDCDTVVARPLRRLWETDLKDCVIGAVMEPTIYKAVKESIDLKEEDPYYNSGVLLVDLEAWRAGGTQQKLLDYWQSKDGKLFASDQDVINGALKGRIKSLPPEYNFFTNYRYFSYGDLKQHCPSYEGVTEEMFVTAKRHPAVIHYMGDERPWIAGNLNHYRKAYETYLARTPWAGTPKERGRELYMFAYHMMDYATVLWPEVRWLISGKVGMKVIEGRNKGKAEVSDET